MKRHILKLIAKHKLFHIYYVYGTYTPNRKEMVRFRVRSYWLASLRAYWWELKHPKAISGIALSNVYLLDKNVTISYYTHKVYFK